MGRYWHLDIRSQFFNLYIRKKRPDMRRVAFVLLVFSSSMVMGKKSVQEYTNLRTSFPKIVSKINYCSTFDCDDYAAMTCAMIGVANCRQLAIENGKYFDKRVGHVLNVLRAKGQTKIFKYCVVEPQLAFDFYYYCWESDHGNDWKHLTNQKIKQIFKGKYVKGYYKKGSENKGDAWYKDPYSSPGKVFQICRSFNEYYDGKYRFPNVMTDCEKNRRLKCTDSKQAQSFACKVTSSNGGHRCLFHQCDRGHWRIKHTWRSLILPSCRSVLHRCQNSRSHDIDSIFYCRHESEKNRKIQEGFKIIAYYCQDNGTAKLLLNDNVHQVDSHLKVHN